VAPHLGFPAQTLDRVVEQFDEVGGIETAKRLAARRYHMDLWFFELDDRAPGFGCAKTPVFNLLVESSSQFGESENKNADDGYPMKAIGKLVLRFLGSHTFSHGLDPKPPFASIDANAGPCPTPAVAPELVGGGRAEKSGHSF
jgi:hypothetical protein